MLLRLLKSFFVEEEFCIRNPYTIKIVANRFEVWLQIYYFIFLDKLLNISYMDKKFEKSSFYLSLNCNKILYIASDINQTVYECLI